MTDEEGKVSMETVDYWREKALTAEDQLELARAALRDMCDCAAAFQGREVIPATEFMEKAGPVVARAAEVLGQLNRSDGGQAD